MSLGGGAHARILFLKEEKLHAKPVSPWRLRRAFLLTSKGGGHLMLPPHVGCH